MGVVRPSLVDRHRDRDADVEYALLTSDAGRALLAEIATTSAPGPAQVQRWRSAVPVEWVQAALRLVEARRRAAGKFTRAGSLWLSPTGAEQATAEPVARHKAARAVTAGFHDAVDLCCGVGGDAIALAGAGLDVLAVDLDPVMARRTRWNAEVYGVEGRVLAVQGRAERFAVPSGAVVHIDPDRRRAGGSARARSVRDYVPGPDVLARLRRTTSGGAIKLGPASDFELLESTGDEVELISLDGECKEAALWYGDLAGGRPRRATCLPAGATWAGNPAAESSCPVAGTIGRFVLDPDPALARSGLLDGFAVRHDLARVASGVDYLTGDDDPRTPFLAAFAVEAVLPLDRKRLRQHLRAHGLIPEAVKIRGLSLVPETVRGWLKGVPGERPVTLLLYGGRGPGRAIVAARTG